MSKSKLIPQLFKTHDRYSEHDRPEVGDRCFFSHALRLLGEEFVPMEKTLLRQSTQCVVVKNHPHVIEVVFDGSDQTDLVSPEFLIRRELTIFGKRFFHDTKDKMSAQTKRLFIGA